MMNHILSIFWNKLVSRPILKFRLKSVGDNFRIGFSFFVNRPKFISVGNNFFSGPFLYMSTNSRAPIAIGNDVMFGPDCKVIGGNHNITWPKGNMRDAPHKTDDKGIVIENDVWLGAGSVLLDGARISEGSVVAASSVVSKYVPPYVVVAGVPARVVKARFSKSDLANVLKSVESHYVPDQIIKIYSENGVNFQRS